MPFYHNLGKFPAKRHTQFRKENGELYHEELFSTEGFSSIYSLVYHAHPPTLVSKIEDPIEFGPKAALEKNMQSRSFLTFNVAPHDDYIKSRKIMLFNKDVYIGVAAPKKKHDGLFF